MTTEKTLDQAEPTSSPAPARSSSPLIWVAILLIVVGMTGIGLGLRYAVGGSSSGSASIVDTTYRRVPPDNDSPWLDSFTLTERSGKLVNSQELAGQPYVTSFFFASCPSICMQQNQKVAEVAKEYGPKGAKFVSITCDPENDPPSRLREYAHRFNADPEQWWFLTGDLTYTRRVAGEMFLVALDKQTHSENLLVSDKWGNLRGHYHWNNPAEMAKLRKQLDDLLAETEEPDEFKQQKAEQAKARAASASDAKQASDDSEKDEEKASEPASQSSAESAEPADDVGEKSS